MIQYLVALSFRNLLPETAISGISIPTWGICPPDLPAAGTTLVHENQEPIDLPSLAWQVRSGAVDRVEWSGYGQRLEYFPPLDQCQAVFPTPPSRRGTGFGPRHLVCPVRAEDIADGSAPHYPLTPVEFYRDIVDRTGLSPVFIGQTEPNAYTDRLRAAFPDAPFREPQQDPLIDFETIRQSRNIALGVSTYSWMAAWLSETAEAIFMAVSGSFNPMQHPSINLLPFGDRRFRFILFPINYAVPIEQHAEVHARLAPLCREIPHDSLYAMLRDAPRFRPDKRAALECLDVPYYLATNEDVAEVARGYGADFAKDHYSDHGFDEGRMPLPFDGRWYANRYPMAAFEIAQGDYRNAFEHYLAIGRQRGYWPHPSEPSL